MDDDAATGAALLTAELLIALEVERALTTDLATDLESITGLLSEALAMVARQQRLIARLTDQIRRRLDMDETGEGHIRPIRLVDCPDIAVPDQMVRVHELRWTLNDGD
jgi:hypothetical protein